MLNALHTIVHIKLVTGEELFAKFQSEEDNVYIISDPLIVEEKQNPYTGMPFITLSKYIAFSKSNVIQLQKSHVIALYIIIDELSVYYNNYLEYNNKFIEPNMMSQINTINTQLELLLQNNIEGTEVLYDTNTSNSQIQDATIHFPNSTHLGSNTIN